MLKAISFGAAVFLVLALVAVFGTDAEWLINYAFSMGIVCLVLAIVFGGGGLPNGMAPGTHMQGHDTKEDRSRRNRWSINLLLVALPNLLGAVLVYIYICTVDPKLIHSPSG